MHSRLNPDRLETIARYCEQQVSDKQFAGIAWQISCQHESSGTLVHGCMDHKFQNVLKEDSIYRIYSMTKPVISVLCLILVERGLLKLGDPVSQWIPAFANQQVLGNENELVPLQRCMTVEDLLTHRSGLSYDFLPDCAVAQQYRMRKLADDGSRSLSELVDVLAELPLAYQPGERWYYSYSSDVLAHLLERVADKPLRLLLQEELLIPLGMQDTDFQVSEASMPRLADMFGQRSLGEQPDATLTSNQLLPLSIENSYPSNCGDTFARGGIGLFSTINDYLRFMSVMQSGTSCTGEQLLSNAMVNFMWCNRLSMKQMPICIGHNAFPGYGWGLAGRVMSDPGKSVNLVSEGEGGWAGAASTHFWIDRRSGFNGIVMSQYLGSAVTLGADIQSLAYSALR